MIFIIELIINGYEVIAVTRDHNLSKPRKHMQQLLAAASRPKATLHSFRHTFNTKLRDLGMSIEDRRVLLSHATSSVTKIYTHPNLEVAKEFINRLNQPL